MSDITGAGAMMQAGASIASATIQANAIKDASKMQIDAINDQRDFVYKNLDPAKLSPMVTEADINKARNSLAEQGRIDPQLLMARYHGEALMENSLNELGPTGDAARTAHEATHEALQGTAGMEQIKDKLVAQANEELKAGATLPPDLQAELMQAGLQQSGKTTGAASGRGTGNQILSTVLGSAGLALKQKRMENAQNLVKTAQDLDTARAGILSNLFPKLQQQQLSALTGGAAAVNQSEALAPQIGMSGQDVANLWLSRVGATSQMALQGAQAQSQKIMGLGQVWGGLAGQLGVIGAQLAQQPGEILGAAGKLAAI